MTETKGQWPKGVGEAPEAKGACNLKIKVATEIREPLRFPVLGDVTLVEWVHVTWVEWVHVIWVEWVHVTWVEWVHMTLVEGVHQTWVEWVHMTLVG